MNPIDRRLLLGAAGLAGAAALSKIASAGPITPPPGPIGPTGLTLTDLAARTSATPQGVAEPRTPVSAQTTPGANGYLYAITAPGSYYLKGDITTPDGSGILIAAANVTLDLCGFTIRSAAVGTGNGIGIDANSVTIRNGGIADFGTGVLNPSSVANTHLVAEDLRITCTGWGLMLGFRGTARRCISAGASASCIEANHPYAVISDCTVSGPSNYGILATSFSVIERCHASGANTGISANGNGSRIVSCTAVSNAGIGIYIGSDGFVQDCLANFNSAGPGGTGIGISGAIGVNVSGCQVNSNAGAGIQLVQNGAVDRCHATSNGPAGIRVGHGSRVSRCWASGHSSAASSAIRLAGGNSVAEDNYLHGNNVGVDALNVSGNLIIRNHMFNHATAIAVNAGGNWYPSIPLGGVNTSTNPLNNIIA